MRSATLLLSWTLLAAGTIPAQEQPAESPTIQILPIMTLDLTGTPTAPVRKAFTWPYLTISYGQGSGSFTPRFWYNTQDRRQDVASRTFSADIRTERWYAYGETVSIAGHKDVGKRAFALHGIPIRLGPIRPSLGIEYTSSSDAHQLFASGGSTIAATSSQEYLSGIFTIGFGGYNHSSFRAMLVYGRVRTANTLGLYVDSQATESPLDIHNTESSRFLAAGGSATLHRWGFTLEGTGLGFHPVRPSYALPRDYYTLTGTASYTSSWYVGVFVRATYIGGLHRDSYNSMQFLNNSWTAGVTVQVP